eukprot:COSAG02_NODE_962_length_15608_cov_16.347692_10_plen_115_part_00
MCRSECRVALATHGQLSFHSEEGTTGTYSTNFTANSTKAISTFGVSSKGMKIGAYVSTASFGFSILAGVKHAWNVNSSAACQPRQYRVRCLVVIVKPVQQIQHCSDATRRVALA